MHLPDGFPDPVRRLLRREPAPQLLLVPMLQNIQEELPVNPVVFQGIALNGGPQDLPVLVRHIIALQNLASLSLHGLADLPLHLVMKKPGARYAAHRIDSQYEHHDPDDPFIPEASHAVTPPRQNCHDTDDYLL